MEETELILGLYIISEYIYCQKSCFYKFYGFEESIKSNVDFMKGRISHEAVHSADTRNRKGFKQLTNLNIFSHKYGLKGKTDLVEFKNDKIIPVEYKKGEVTEYLNHKVQLCLQVLCLEEMYSTEISEAFLFYIDANTRKKVLVDSELKNLTIDFIYKIKQNLLNANPKLFKKENNHKCAKCSFYETCLPEITN